MEINQQERERIGQLIADLRNKRGLSVRELAELADVSYSNISKIEHGRYNVSIDILSKVTAVMNAEITIVEK